MRCYDRIAAPQTTEFRYFASLKDPGEGPVYTYKSNWDANVMYGCNCDDGTFGPDCSLRKCPHGDDPLTENVIDNPSSSESYFV